MKYEGENYKKTGLTDTKEIAKLLRVEFKNEFPDFKFSITAPRYNQVVVAIMKTPHPLMRDFKDL